MCNDHARGFRQLRLLLQMTRQGGLGNKHLFLTVLEAGKPKIMVLANAAASRHLLVSRRAGRKRRDTLMQFLLGGHGELSFEPGENVTSWWQKQGEKR